MHGRTNRPLGERTARDRALVLPLIGLMLLMLPVAGIVPTEARVGGVPLILAYVFLVWAGLIASAAALSRRLATENGAPTPAEVRDD